MRILFVVIIALHALIHLMGYVKSLDNTLLAGIQIAPSKTWGILWLLAGLVLLAAAIAYLLDYDYAWLIGLIACLLSQILIVKFWGDAKFGTVPNTILLIVVSIGMMRFQYNNTVADVTAELLQGQVAKAGQQSFPLADLAKLPPPVRRWLQNSGVRFDAQINHVSMHQQLRMKLKPEQDDWYEGQAQQQVVLNPPGFVWRAQIGIFGTIDVLALDHYIDGRGGTLVKALGFITVVDENTGDKIHQSALQRFLAEIVYYPQAALAPYISWELVDSRSARATMSYAGVSGAGMFYFGEDGLVEKFSAKRYRELDADAQPEDWIITVQQHARLDGISVPIKAGVSWQLESGEWTWLEVEVTDLVYAGP